MQLLQVLLFLATIVSASLRKVDVEDHAWELYSQQSRFGRYMGSDLEVDEDLTFNQHPCNCELGETCVMEEDRQFRCRCVENCRPEENPRFKVCSNFNETWESECALYQMRCLCRKNQNGCKAEAYQDIKMDYYGSCAALECPEGQLEDFPNRMKQWIFITMEQLYQQKQLTGMALKLMEEAQKSKEKRWVNAVLWKFCNLDVNPRDSYVSRDELYSLRAYLLLMEPCLDPFVKKCDADGDNRISLQEWGYCFGLKEDEIEDKCS